MSENIINKKRVTEKVLDIEGRTFKIVKFDPLLGNYILLKCVTEVLPFGIGEKAGIEHKSEAKPINKEDFISLQADVLKHAYEILPGDTPPVVRENDTYGVMDLSMGIAIQLLIGVLAFNFSDFFVGDGFSNIKDLLDSVSANM